MKLFTIFLMGVLFTIIILGTREPQKAEAYNKYEITDLPCKTQCIGNHLFAACLDQAILEQTIK